MSQNEHPISNIGKTLSVTASALLQSQNISDTILSAKSPYAQMLKDTVDEKGAKYPSMDLVAKWRAGRQNTENKDSFQDVAQDSSSYFKNRFTNERKAFQLLSYINDDLLNDLDTTPHSKNKLLTQDPANEEQPPSLYQGFNALLSQEETAFSITESNTSQTNMIEPEMNEVKQVGIISAVNNSQDLDPALVNASYNLTELATMKADLLEKLSMLQINKKIAMFDIEEIDSKLQRLKIRRDLMFNRIADLEDKELSMENSISSIEERVNILQEHGLDNSKENFSESGGNLANLRTPIVSIPNVSGSSPGRRQSFISDSSLEENINNSLNYNELLPAKRLSAFFQQRNKKHKKALPTLQQYYTSGSHIKSITGALLGPVSCLDFDIPFGALCSAGWQDPVVKVWDLSKNKQIGLLSGHLATVHCMEMDNNYNMLATGSRDATLKIWNVSQAVQSYGIDPDTVADSCIFSFQEHSDEVTALSINFNHLLSGSQDRTVRQWDMNTGKCVQTLDVSFVNALSHSLVTTLDPPVVGALKSYDVALATGTKDGMVRLWDLRTGEIVRTLKGHTGAISCLKFDLHNLITGSLDNSVRVWDLRSGSTLDAFRYQSPVTSLDFDDEKVAIANGSNSIQVYNRKEQRHWVCGQNEEMTGSTNFVRLKNGYLVEARDNGVISTWAV
ncbi:Mdv1p KNAG_0B01610 [Huiozyma naganishii CBS 8797]|uniref:Uncharacterized protein n=1 Tax=Huiozyma naganishii (strain ATCC MYA-139 / BCRC 22969 / CBS 8797 / KCTC 17520 / NBRC 10181 / NCYC 3082 / Yp74L-3) TaxID=1071383 RepID=J7RGE0_HUIN7|nr:hypothetical protein KNAG_0B01610 [Kazachstania naganishii CBS 8797]CCK68608.1 hypothetical protein KNAG_0B01610 [Kazachstania naganishii CBS 8797]